MAAVDGAADPQPAQPPRTDSNGGATGVTSAPQPTADAEIYQAFISYSHAADRKLAPALQRGLRRLAQPWYRPPAFRVFRDETTLTATPQLWPDIEQAMAGSTFFILMASPAAAASPWVDQEVAWWLAHKPRDRLLIALTDGDLKWDAAVGDFDWSVIHKALPLSLRGAFTQQPRWEDLSWARTAERVSLRDPRFRSCIAGLAAPMRGAAKDELIDEDVRQSRRVARWRRAAVATVVVLALLAGITAVVAIQQRNEARRQAAVATSRQLAAQAISMSDTDPQLAALLSVAASRIADTDEARTSLFRQLDRDQQIEHFIPSNLREVGGAISNPDGNVVVVASSAKTILWNVEKRLRLWLFLLVVIRCPWSQMGGL